MIDNTKKYKRPKSKLYKALRLAAFKSGSTITTAGRKWVTNGSKDIFLKVGEEIPAGFRPGRTINFTEEQKLNYSRKISLATKGRTVWNAGKHGIYSAEYRKKISDNHADVSGKNNPQYGKFGKNHPKFGKPMSAEAKRKIGKANKGKRANAKWMYDPLTKNSVLVLKNDIQSYLDKGYKFGRKFNNPWSKNYRKSS